LTINSTQPVATGRSKLFIQENCVKTLKLSKLTAVVFCCTLLLALGACSKKKPPTINEELQLAIGLSNITQVNRLIDQGADVNSKEDDTPLYTAAILAQRDIAEVLLARGADVNGKGDARGGDRTPLHGAALRGSKPVAELLIAKGADLKAKDIAGATPLHMAAREGRKDVVELLVAKGAEINALDKELRTPLAYSRDKKRFVVTDWLQQHGAK
jgi:cytohesin